MVERYPYPVRQHRTVAVRGPIGWHRSQKPWTPRIRQGRKHFSMEDGMRRKGKRLLSLLTTISMALALFGTMFAAEPVEPEAMYAAAHTEGAVQEVIVDPYSGIETGNTTGHEERLDPTNVYGPFDATSTSGINEYFFGLASREWSEFTFADDFANVDGNPDIAFREVTWGAIGSWHAEAALVFLTDAYVWDADGNIVPYVPTAGEGVGYFAGIVGNKECYHQFDDAEDAALLAEYAATFGVGSRGFHLNGIETDPEPNEVRTTTLFYLPDEVVSAAGVRLVDITDVVYNRYGSNPATYLGSSGLGRGLTFVERLLGAGFPNGDRISVEYAIDEYTGAVLNLSGNTDGFDLDAIRVYKYVPDLHRICGYKLDADTGEGLEGWEIELYRYIRETWVYITSAWTGPDGKYCFEDLPPGEYEVREVIPTDEWEQVFPMDVHRVTLPDEDVLYGIQRSTGKIFEVDPLTAAATEYYQITELPLSSVGPNGLAFDQMSGNLYFTTYRGLAKLYVTDTPTEVYLGELEGEIACADFFDGRYYYIAGGTSSGYGGPTDDLYEVTFDAGGMVAGSIKYPDISGEYDSAWTFDGDIAISADGVIYGFGRNNNPGGGYEFFKVNRDGTDFEMIRDIGYTFSLQLAFSGDGVLYGHDAQQGRFFTVDTTDGTITQVSDGDNTYTDTASGTQTHNFENRTTLGSVPAFKFYDENANGVFDEREAPIEGWMVQILRDDVVIETRMTDADGEVLFTVPYGDYTIREIMPLESCWKPTTALSQTVTVVRRETADRVEFGNLCLGYGGGKTLGFWSNKNGLSYVGDTDLEMLRSLNLRDADGDPFDPTSKNSFRSWLLSANATNMAYMLSAQLAAMELNVYNGFVDGDALIYAPGTTSANPLGFATVASVMAEANNELGLHGTAYDGDAWRMYQQDLKNALDWANNNWTFVRPGPCTITYPS